VEDDSFEEKEARLASLMHGGLDARIRSVFESVRKREREPVADLSILLPAIAGLYAAFEHRRLSQPFRHCECCVLESMVDHWKRDSVKSLSADDLWAVMSNVPSTAGSASDVLYFAPRLLEHAAIEECVIDLSWAFSSLQRPDALQTTRAEREALRHFFEPIWLNLRESDPQHALNISSIVLPTAVLTDEITYYLDLWIGSRALQLYRSRSADSFWYQGSKAHNGVFQWLKEH
jgi:hypothetical protein